MYDAFSVPFILSCWKLENEDQIKVQMSQESLPHLKANRHFHFVDRESLIETFLTSNKAIMMGNRVIYILVRWRFW